ncbi:hypothetical protein PUN28_014697 [Cardiocondyla obscurior]|uniref:Uncharacterized protein n=1 Tax=Cardiocondyla obscurior TaxID=286306 RepID=A0AAW2EWR0_9HYME
MQPVRVACTILPRHKSSEKKKNKRRENKEWRARERNVNEEMPERGVHVATKSVAWDVHALTLIVADRDRSGSCSKGSPEHSRLANVRADLLNSRRELDVPLLSRRLSSLVSKSQRSESLIGGADCERKVCVYRGVLFHHTFVRLL